MNQSSKSQKNSADIKVSKDDIQDKESSLNFINDAGHDSLNLALGVTPTSNKSAINSLPGHEDSEKTKVIGNIDQSQLGLSTEALDLDLSGFLATPTSPDKSSNLDLSLDLTDSKETASIKDESLMPSLDISDKTQAGLQKLNKDLNLDLILSEDDTSLETNVADKLKELDNIIKHDVTRTNISELLKEQKNQASLSAIQEEETLSDKLLREIDLQEDEDKTRIKKLPDLPEIKEQDEDMFSEVRHSPSSNEAATRIVKLPQNRTLYEGADNDSKTRVVHFNHDQLDETDSSLDLTHDSFDPIDEKKEIEPISRDTRQTSAELAKVSADFNWELDRLRVSLSHLKADREQLLKKIQELEQNMSSRQSKELTLITDLEEKKIENQILRKKIKEIDADLHLKLDVEEERRRLHEEKNKHLLEQIANLQQKEKMHLKLTSSKDSELVEKFELLKADRENQIQVRDKKILELKRRLDSMEFELHGAKQHEQKVLREKHEIDEKFQLITKSLKSLLLTLEVSPEENKILSKIKKSMEI